MIQNYDFSTDENNRETIPATDGFPCVVKYTDFKSLIGEIVPWHWHEFFEITIPLQSGMHFHSSNKQDSLKKGDAAFVNSSVLHSVDWENSEGGKSEYTLFFDRELLSGGYGNVFYEKYVMPVALCKALDFYVIRPDHTIGLRMMTLLDQIITLFKEEPVGFELLVRNALSNFWLLLLEETKDLRENSDRIDYTDNVRLKQMMNHIHTHYPEKVYLDEIAAAAGVSSRECTRCFKREIKMSPMDYLNQYRVRIAADQLRTTQKSIHLIGEECGFVSDSYFGKMFRELMGSSPRDYRNRH